jgi:hypothetical protein
MKKFMADEIISFRIVWGLVMCMILVPMIGGCAGGGRKAAAGINALAQDSVAQFIDKFNLQFGKEA